MEKAAVQGSGGDSLIGNRFGAYSILEHLGKGGMGDVYKAVQIGLDRVVALKVLPVQLARSREFSERFFSEAYAISRLQHQNIVTIYDYGEEDGQKFIAMQYIQGPTLSKLIQAEKKLEYERIVGIAKQICRGLKYAHQCEIVHRDIKSGNIMVEPGDKIYISDFGIAKVIDAPSITTTGMAMGTPEFMAPEQCEGGLVDGQSDIYALGAILYEMVTGKPPFLAETPLAVAYKQVHEMPALLAKKCPDVPPRLELIVAKCLKKKKEERYLNADELLKDLDSAHLDIAPQAVAAKAQPPSDLRITDRREKERRYLPGDMPMSRAYLFGTLGLFGLVFCMLGYLLLRTGRPAEGLRWIKPAAAKGISLLSPTEGNMEPAHLFDGKLSTAWAAPAGSTRQQGEIRITLPGKTLLTGMVAETGLQNPEAGSPAFGYPKSLFVEVAGRRPFRFNLAETDQPQYLTLGGVITGEVVLRFEPPASGGSEEAVAAPPVAAAPGTKAPYAVREVRFLGLPYE